MVTTPIAPYDHGHDDHAAQVDHLVQEGDAWDNPRDLDHLGQDTGRRGQDGDALYERRRIARKP